MSDALDYIDDLLITHHAETADGIVDVAPSRLNRGQGTERDFYILKIDLVRSTMLLHGKHRVTYLRLAHTFLSTVDKITQDWGADNDQTEYAGDSVLAYFPDSVSAENVITAACYSRKAVERIANLGGAVGVLKPRCRLALHFAPLIVAKIGPRAGSFISAIGHPIHRVAKIEEGIDEGVGRATVEFYQRVAPENRKFFTEIFTERQVLVPSFQTQPLLAQQRPMSLAGLLYNNSSHTPPPQPPQYRPEKTTHGYDLRWAMLNKAIGLA